MLALPIPARGDFAHQPGAGPMRPAGPPTRFKRAARQNRAQRETPNRTSQNKKLSFSLAALQAAVGLRLRVRVSMSWRSCGWLGSSPRAPSAGMAARLTLGARGLDPSHPIENQSTRFDAAT